MSKKRKTYKRTATKKRPVNRARKSTRPGGIEYRNSNKPTPAVIPDGFRKVGPQDVIPLGFERDESTGVLYMNGLVDAFSIGPDGEPRRTGMFVEEPLRGPQPYNIGQVLIVLAQRAHNCGTFVKDGEPDEQREAEILNMLFS